MKISLLPSTARTIVCILLLAFSSGSYAQESDYHGFRCLNFKFEGREARIVFPDKAEEQRHWIWRAVFWGHEPQTEIALLRKGFHLAWIDAFDLYGSPEAVSLWNRYYEHITTNYQLSRKVVLEGMSHGGLYIYNWGSENPGKVACIYADAPVCDLRSWPGGKWKGKGSPQDWQLYLKKYGLTETTVNEFRGMPVYNCRKLAEAGIPALHVCGAVDEVVPVEENTYVLEKAYKDAGGDIRIILKEGIGHHPHSLKDPSPIVRFILSNTNPSLLDEPRAPESLMTINFRDGVNRCSRKFTREKKGRVAFLGGSITFNEGWRTMVCDYLRQKYPATEFEFINAGIPSLGSTPGSMRFSDDVLSKGVTDLLFVEAAVNDATNGVDTVRQLRGMEGIVYQAIASNPDIDIVMLHFADQSKMADYNNGRIPEVIRQHEKVAEHYSIPSIDLAKEVNDRIISGEFTWRDDFRDLHPSPFGQSLYFSTIKHFFETSWSGIIPPGLNARILPQPLDPFSYVRGHFMNINKAATGKGWTLVSNWKPSDKASVRDGFVNVDVLEASVPGAELKISFKGTATGLFVTSGPDAGMLEFSIDGSDFKEIDQFTQWSKGLHLTWLIMLDDELENRKHKLVLRISDQKNPGSKGNACRIHKFALN